MYGSFGNNNICVECCRCGTGRTYRPGIVCDCSMFCNIAIFLTTLFGNTLSCNSSVKEIPFDDYAESIPAFIAMIMMQLTYSIAEGVLLGMISYVVINFLCGNYGKLTPSMYIIAVFFILKYVFIK